MKLILFIIIGILASCSAENTRLNVEEKVLATKNPQKMTDESKFIHDKFFRNAMLQPCLSQQIFERKTNYGAWHKLTSCNLSFNGIDLNSKEIGIHKDREGNINGLRFFVYPETTYGNYLRQKAAETVVNESKTCIQYYQNTFPIVTIVDESLCDAIQYEQI